MKAILVINTELQISHNNNYWFAKNNFLKLKAKEITDLDDKIKITLTNLLIKEKGKKIKVNMVYDFSTFPKWLHQYHSHYFNRILIFDI